jgi:tetratricopeptide (TPR) repeat protein
MKTSAILLVLACAVTASALVYLHKQKTPTPVAPIAETASNQTTEKTLPEENGSTNQEAPQTVSTNSAAMVAIAAAAETKVNDSTNAVSKTVDALLSAKGQKWALIEQLQKAGQLDAVIAELQQRMAADPNNPEIATTLGEALLNKLKALKDAGGDYNAVGILAMQADQDFNAALKIDPQNWEAQFVKYSSMTYWPPNPEIDNQVVQNLSSLIDQQEKMPSQPDFAQTYLLLGNEYQKLGQPQQAIATWQLGAQKFPNDPALRNKIAAGSQ